MYTLLYNKYPFFWSSDNKSQRFADFAPMLDLSLILQLNKLKQISYKYKT